MTLTDARTLITRLEAELALAREAYWDLITAAKEPS